MRRLLFWIVPALAAAIAAIVLATSGSTADGPLDGPGAGHRSPVPVGAEFDSFSALLFNEGDDSIEIERIRLTKVSGPVELVQVRTRLVPDQGVAFGGGLVSDPESQDPPSEPLLENNRLPVPKDFNEVGEPEQGMQVLFRVRMKQAGIGHSGGIEVTYRAGGKKYTEVYDFEMTLCAPREAYIGKGSARCGSGQTPAGHGILG